MNPMQLLQMVSQLKSNPMSILSKFGVPQSMSNNPQDVIQYLMNNGNVTQSQYDNAVKQAQTMGYKF